MQLTFAFVPGVSTPVMRAMSSAAMLTRALSLNLKLSIKHGWNVHTYLCKASEIFQSCTDFCHGPPVVTHVQSST